MFVNIQGLNSKLVNLEMLMDDESFDVVCIAEHWFRGDSLLSVAFQKYVLASHYSRQILQIQSISMKS